MIKDDIASREQLAWVSSYYEGDLNPLVIAAARQAWIRKIWEAKDGELWPLSKINPENSEQLAERMRGWGR